MNIINPALVLTFVLASLVVGGCRHPSPGEGATRAVAQPVEVVHRGKAAVKPAGPVVVSAAELAQAFSYSPADARVRFDQRRVRVTGAVVDVGADAGGAPVLTLAGGGVSRKDVADRVGSYKGVLLALDSSAWSDASAIQIGATATVACKGVAIVSGQVTSQSCAIVHGLSSAPVAP